MLIPLGPGFGHRGINLSHSFFWPTERSEVKKQVSSQQLFTLLQKPYPPPSLPPMSDLWPVGPFSVSCGRPLRIRSTALQTIRHRFTSPRSTSLLRRRRRRQKKIRGLAHVCRAAPLLLLLLWAGGAASLEAVCDHDAAKPPRVLPFRGMNHESDSRHDDIRRSAGWTTEGGRAGRKEGWMEKIPKTGGRWSK